MSTSGNINYPALVRQLCLRFREWSNVNEIRLALDGNEVEDVSDDPRFLTLQESLGVDPLPREFTTSTFRFGDDVARVGFLEVVFKDCALVNARCQLMLGSTFWNRVTNASLRYARKELVPMLYDFTSTATDSKRVADRLYWLLPGAIVVAINLDLKDAVSVYLMEEEYSGFSALM